MSRGESPATVNGAWSRGGPRSRTLMVLISSRVIPQPITSDKMYYVNQDIGGKLLAADGGPERGTSEGSVPGRPYAPRAESRNSTPSAEPRLPAHRTRTRARCRAPSNRETQNRPAPGSQKLLGAAPQSDRARSCNRDFDQLRCSDGEHGPARSTCTIHAFPLDVPARAGVHPPPHVPPDAPPALTAVHSSTDSRGPCASACACAWIVGVTVIVAVGSRSSTCRCT